MRWFESYLPALGAPGDWLLEVGCGPGEDAAALRGLGFRVAACDVSDSQLRRARQVLGSEALARVDHSRPLPFRDGVFRGAVASLTLHYFPWEVTRSAISELRRVTAPGGALLMRVNSTDDVESGSREGIEVEPGLRHYPDEAEARAFGRWGEFKRFFNEDSVRASLDGAYRIETLRHTEFDRGGTRKRAWECLARAV